MTRITSVARGVVVAEFDVGEEEPGGRIFRGSAAPAARLRL